MRKSRQYISEQNPRSERQHGKHKRYGGFVHGAKIPVQQKQDPDPDVTRPFRTKIRNARGNHFRFGRIDKNRHQRSGENTDDHVYDRAKNNRKSRCRENAFPDPLFFARAVILSGKRREPVSEILHGHIGKRIDFHRRSKRRHNDRSETVDKPLYGKDPEVHDRLLQTSHHGKPPDRGNDNGIFRKIFFSRDHVFIFQEKENGNSEPGKTLRDDRRESRALHARPEPRHKQEVEPDVHTCRNGKKDERRCGISDRAKKGREKVIKENGDDPRKHDQKIIFHRGHDRRRHAEKGQYPVAENIGSNA